jgi:GxxExxY protein
MRTEPSIDVNQLSNQVIGAAIEVHRALGPGYLETTYEEALCVELELRGIPFERQKPFRVLYKGFSVTDGRIDILVAGVLVVELKAVESLSPIHTAQALAYLKATNLHLALVINFNVAVLKSGIRRVVLS